MKRRKLRKFLHDHGLAIVTFGLFLIFILGQSISGFLSHNDDLREHGRGALTFFQYIDSGTFIESVFENWEGEFLQMGIYVILTRFLFEKGSAESKNRNEKEPKSKQHWKGGLIHDLYSHSLSIALLVLFALSFILHAVSGTKKHNFEELLHGPSQNLNVLQYIETSEFWFESFQNWQSEFLSIGLLVVLSVFLREKGSAQSKPVSAKNDEEAA